MLLQYHLSGVNYRNWDITVCISCLLFLESQTFLKLLECKASALTLSEGTTCPGSCLCQQEEGPAIPSFPLADLSSHLWKWTDSAQQNLQPAVQKCAKRH